MYIEYRTADDRGVYRTDYIGYDAYTKCHKVKEMVWESGNLIKEQEREVCEGSKYEQKY